MSEDKPCSTAQMGQQWRRSFKPDFNIKQKIFILWCQRETFSSSLPLLLFCVFSTSLSLPQRKILPPVLMISPFRSFVSTLNNKAFQTPRPLEERLSERKEILFYILFSRNHRKSSWPTSFNSFFFFRILRFLGFVVSFLLLVFCCCCQHRTCLSISSLQSSDSELSFPFLSHSSSLAQFCGPAVEKVSAVENLQIRMITTKDRDKNSKDRKDRSTKINKKLRCSGAWTAQHIRTLSGCSDDSSLMVW